MTFPDFEHETARATYETVRAAKIQHQGRWIPGRIKEWVQDAAGWHGLWWPERVTIGNPALPDDVPTGWLDLDQLHPANHPTPVTPSPVPPPPGCVDDTWWPTTHN